MSEVNFVNDLFLDEAVEFATLEVVLFLQGKIKYNTPRDKNRLPENINRKDGKKPYRSSFYKPVMIGGNWYEGVTGNLKRSINHEKVEDMSFLIGVMNGPATEYARSQEFGGVYNPPRSFIRKGIFDNLKEAQTVFGNALKSKLKM